MTHHDGDRHHAHAVPGLLPSKHLPQQHTKRVHVLRRPRGGAEGNPQSMGAGFRPARIRFYILGRTADAAAAMLLAAGSQAKRAVCVYGGR
jgi:hypothetical protein